MREVWVEDNMHLSVGTCAGVPLLRNVVEEKRRGNSNIVDTVRVLLKGEDLEIARYNAKVINEFLDLQIISTVKLNFQNPARLNCLANYAGLSFWGPTGSGSEPYMLVHAGNGGRLLWFPEWETPTDLSEVVTKWITGKSIQRHFLGDVPQVLKLRCFLKVGDKEETLFEASPWDPLPNVPDAEFLSRVHQSHKMSGNDWCRIFTDFRLAKPGYYAIDVSGFTNRPPAITNFTQRPMSPSQLEDFEARLKGVPRRPLPKIKYSIDGSFDDWKEQKTAWMTIEANQPDSDAKSVKSDRSFAITECCYANDENYLYVFFKFKPTVQQRYDNLNRGGEVISLGNVGWLYFDTDSDKSTGAQLPAVKSPLVGSDLMIAVQAGGYFYRGDKERISGCQVSYDISTWDSSAKEFGPGRNSRSSRSEIPLINHGKDGVEMAILLSDIRKAIGEKFILIVEGDALSSGYHRVSIELK